MYKRTEKSVEGHNKLARDTTYLNAKWKGTLTVFTLPDTGSTRQIW